MDMLTIVLLAALVILGVILAVVLLRQGGGSREAEQMRQQLALALSQQAETVQRVERSLREQEQGAMQDLLECRSPSLVRHRYCSVT